MCFTCHCYDYLSIGSDVYNDGRSLIRTKKWVFFTKHAPFTESVLGIFLEYDA